MACVQACYKLCVKLRVFFNNVSDLRKAILIQKILKKCAKERNLIQVVKSKQIYINLTPTNKLWFTTQDMRPFAFAKVHADI